MISTDSVVVHEAIIREVINGCAMMLCLTLTIMIGVFMWDSVAEWYARSMNGTLKAATRTWKDVPGIQTACALWWVFLAESYRTGAVWVLYNLAKGQKDVGVFFGYGAYWSSYGYLFAGTILNLGLLRAIYIFTPPEWKSRVWIYAAIGAVVFCSAPTLFSVIRTQLYGF